GGDANGMNERLLPEEITVSIPKGKKVEIERFQALRDKLLELQDAVKSGKVPKFDELTLASVPDFRLVQCDAHLYAPLLFRGKHSDVHVSPIALNDGEAKLVDDLQKVTRSEAGKALIGDAELYLLRNESRRGVGFF